MNLVFGFDPSPNGSAVVCFVTNERYEIIETKWLSFVKLAKMIGEYECGAYVGIPKEFTNKKIASGDFDRHHFVTSVMQAFTKGMIAIHKPNEVYSAFEGYAMGAIGRTFLIGETQGLLRYNAYLMGNLRLYDIQGIKQFATGRGNAEKTDMLMAYRNTGLCEPKGEPDSLGIDFGIVTDDLCDAWWIGKMLVTEMQLRLGVVTLESLPQNHRGFFLRVTDKDPVNVLARPFQSYSNFEMVMTKKDCK